METRIEKITGNRAEDRKIIEEAAEIIKAGGLVAIPTETVYGLAGSAQSADRAHLKARRSGKYCLYIRHILQAC